MSNIKSTQLGKNSRKHIREALESKTLTTAIIPLASTEQHNEHLAMEQDAASVEYISKKVAEKLFPNVVVTPTVTVGSASHHMHHPGTLTLQPETLVLVLHDMVESLVTHGFNYIIILNGHGGNVRALEKHMDTIRPKEAKFLFYSYWDICDENFVIKQLGKDALFPGHSGLFETSFALAAFPENVDMTAEYPKKILTSTNKWVSRDHLLFNESRKASKEIGEVFLKNIIENLVSKIKKWARI